MNNNIVIFLIIRPFLMLNNKKIKKTNGITISISLVVKIQIDHEIKNA